MGVGCREERKGNGGRQRGAGGSELGEEILVKETVLCDEVSKRREAEKRRGVALGLKPSKAVPGCWESALKPWGLVTPNARRIST